MKTCSKCGIEKPYLDYNKDSSKPDGHYPSCKPCKRIKDYAWVAKNPDKVSAIMKRFSTSEKGRLAAIKNVKLYKKAHKEKHLAHRAVQQKVKHGTMIKPKSCDACQQLKALEGHHYNGYEGAHRFEVRWLCRLCHRKAHAS